MEARVRGTCLENTVYVDDVRVADDLDYQTATSLSTEIAAGSHEVHLWGRRPSTVDNTLPIVTIPVEFAEDGQYTLIANGSLTNFAYRVLSGARSESMVESKVEFRMIHGVADLGSVDVRPLERVEDTSTGELVFFLSVITSVSSEELPEVFALQGNYPNPFNPSTRIVFDLPSAAEVSVEVLDLLGRPVLSLGSQSIEAGANRTVELDGSLLASGTYLYRIIARMEGDVKVQTGRMVLIK